MADFERLIHRAVADAEKALASAGELQERYETAREFTAQFLDECARAGITRVSVGMKHESVPCTMSWPFGHQGSVFQFVPKRNEDPRRSPAIWGVCKRMGIANGCGNPDEHQADTSHLLDGVYHLKSGVWKKVK